MGIYTSQYIVNNIYKQIHLENFFPKILYSFIETYFFTNENPYGGSFSLRRHTYADLLPNCSYLSLYFILCH